MKNETKAVSTRVTLRLAELIEEFRRREAHLNPANFIRDAIRHKTAKRIGRTSQVPPGDLDHGLTHRSSRRSRVGRSAE